MAVYPTTYAEWRAMGYSGYEADFERWKRDMDVLVGLLDERISGLTGYRRSGVVAVERQTTSQFVTFSSPIISTKYRVWFTVEGLPVATRFTYSDQQLDGFTMHINVLSAAMNVGYLAMVDR